MTLFNTYYFDFIFHLLSKSDTNYLYRHLPQIHTQHPLDDDLRPKWRQFLTNQKIRVQWRD